MPRMGETSELGIVEKKIRDRMDRALQIAKSIIEIQGPPRHVFGDTPEGRETKGQFIVSITLKIYDELKEQETGPVKE